MLYTPKHLSLITGLSQKQLAKVSTDGLLTRYTAGDLIRYEADDDKVFYLQWLKGYKRRQRLIHDRLFTRQVEAFLRQERYGEERL